MKRRSLARSFCYGVTLCVLLGLSTSAISRCYNLLKSGNPGRDYPWALYPVLPVPGTSSVYLGPGATGADFSQVYASARSLSSGYSAYATPAGHSTDAFGRSPSHPPLMNWLHVPLAQLRYADALIVHTFFWTIALIALSLVFLYRMGLLRHGFALVVMLVSLYCFTPVGYTHLERGQFELVVATAAVAAMMCLVLPRSQYGMASLVGVLSALKWTAIPYFGSFATLGFGASSNRRRLSLLLMPAMMAIATVSLWPAVLEYWTASERSDSRATPEGLTFEWFLPRVFTRALPFIVTVAVTGLIWCRGRHEADRRQMLLAVVAPFAVALMSCVICSGNSFEYRTVAMMGVLPGVVVWIERAPLVRSSQRVAVAFILVLFLPFAFRVFGFGDSLAPRTIAGIYAALTAAMVCSCFLIILSASPAMEVPHPAGTRSEPMHVMRSGANAYDTFRRNTLHMTYEGLRGWAVSALYAIAATVLLTNLASFRPPAAHRFVDILKPGAADLIPTVNAAHALLRGENPYHLTDFAVPDPYFFSRGANEGFSYLYPPSHALLYVPLAWLAHGDYFTAIRIQLVISVACIVALAWIVVRLVSAIARLDSSYTVTLVPIVGLALGLNPGNLLGMERGQSDLITSLFAWLAVLCFCQHRLAAAAFLAVAATLLKGYGLVLGGGLVLLGLLESWRRTLLGVALAVSCLLLPVVRYVPDAVQAYSIRSSMFWSGWTNQGFANLAFSLGLPRDGGRIALTVLALASAVLAWLCLFRAHQTRDDKERHFWAVAFGTAALSSVVGFSLNSISYAVVVLMPGAITLALSQDRFFAHLVSWRRTVLGGVLAFGSVALFVFDFADVFGLRVHWLHAPPAAASQVVFAMVISVSALAKLWAIRRRRF